MRKSHGLYQERDTTSSLYFSVFLLTAPSANETTTASMEQMFFTPMFLHEHDPCNRSEKWSARNEQWQQSLVQSVNKFLTSTVPTSIVGLVIGLNVILTSRVLQKGINYGSAPTDHRQSVTLSRDENFMLPFEQLQKRQCRRSLSVR